VNAFGFHLPKGIEEELHFELPGWLIEQAELEERYQRRINGSPAVSDADPPGLEGMEPGQLRNGYHGYATMNGGDIEMKGEMGEAPALDAQAVPVALDMDITMTNGDGDIHMEPSLVMDSQ